MWTVMKRQISVPINFDIDVWPNSDFVMIFFASFSGVLIFVVIIIIVLH